MQDLSSHTLFGSPAPLASDATVKRMESFEWMMHHPLGIRSCGDRDGSVKMFTAAKIAELRRRMAFPCTFAELYLIQKLAYAQHYIEYKTKQGKSSETRKWYSS